jgi:ABC-2 type transport system ATP-binding protein
MARVPLLVCRGLRKSFGHRVAVDDVSFEVAPGQAYGLLGPNGAGKTTTIRMICGLFGADGGEVLIQGRRLDTAPLAAKAAIGFVPHEVALYTDVSALENLKFWGQLHGLSGKRLRGRAAEALEFVGLAERANDKVGQFSGGMQRRLNLAVALVHQPKLLVLDEPTVGVDPQSRTAILERLVELRESGVAILYTTHYMEEVERVCDVVGIIDHGPFAAAVHHVRGVREVRAGLDGLHLTCDDGGAVLPGIVQAAACHNVVITSLDVHEPGLEHVFLHLTGRELRD